MQTDTPVDGVIFWDLMAAVVLSILAFGTVEPWSIAIFEINALILAGLLALRPVIDPRIRLEGARILLPFAAFLALAVIQIIPFGSSAPAAAPETVPIAELGPGTLSLDPQATLEAASKILALLIYLCAALQIMRKPDRRRIVLVVFAAFGFAVSLFAIVQRLTYTGKMYWIRTITPYAAPFGPYGNYNHFAGMIELMLPVPLAWAMLARIDGERRLLWIISIIMMAAAAVLSFSRSGTLILMLQAGLLVALIQWSGARSTALEGAGKTILPVALLAGIAVMAFWIGGETLLKRIGTFGQGTAEYSVATRLEYWSASSKIFLDHPVAGVGIGAFPAIYPAYGVSSAKYERLEQAHNDYLQILTDAGLIGALIAAWFLLEVFRRIRSQWRQLGTMRSRDRAWLIGGTVSLAGIALHSFVDFNLQIAANALLAVFILGVMSVESKK